LTLVLDTGPLLAALDADDPDHQRCAALVSTRDEDLAVPTLVLAELDYWLAKRGGGEAWLAFLDDVLAGAYRVEPPTQADLERARALQDRYRDLALGIVDSTVLALVERLRESKLATLDHRHFATVRPVHVESLQLLP
jgi:predicted nucleic acid-binding protein